MAYRSSTVNTGTSNTPSTTVPAGVQADDIVILTFLNDLSTSTVDPADFPTGFTELDEFDLTFDGATTWVGWKRLTGADAGSYTFGDIAGSSPWVCIAAAHSGRHTTNPPVIGTRGSSNSGNTSPVSLGAGGVTAVAGDDLVWIGGPDVNGTGIGNGFTAPSGYTLQQQGELTFSNLGLATQDNVGAGATGTVTGTFALTSGLAAWVSWLIRIPAAAGGGAATPRVLASLGVGT